jgi:hypothetical protein
LRHVRRFEPAEWELLEHRGIVLAVPTCPHTDALAHVVLAFGADVARRGEHLPRAVVNVVAGAVLRYLAFDPHFAVGIALADDFNFARSAGAGVDLGFLTLIQKRALEPLRHPQFAALLGECRYAQRHHHCQCEPARCDLMGCQYTFHVQIPEKFLVAGT